VHIDLRVTAEELRLEIKDNGRGITEAELASPRSLGLIGSRERAIACGGELMIRGVRNQGTTVLLQIPQAPIEGVTS
jgi:signal transduction histidine kinase